MVIRRHGQKSSCDSHSLLALTCRRKTTYIKNKALTTHKHNCSEITPEGQEAAACCFVLPNNSCAGFKIAPPPKNPPPTICIHTARCRDRGGSCFCFFVKLLSGGVCAGVYINVCQDFTCERTHCRVRSRIYCSSITYLKTPISVVILLDKEKLYFNNPP